MKLIVDVPDNVYAKVMEYCEHNEIVEAVYGYIYHGIPLEQIRAEIDGLYEGMTNYYDNRPGMLKDKVLEIIDKYAKAQ